jgi:hypothetical protein
MSDAYALQIGYMEPCEDCGRGKSNPLRLLPTGDGGELMAVLCDACHDRRIAEQRAEKERRLLADWGTLRDRRTA